MDSIYYKRIYQVTSLVPIPYFMMVIIIISYFVHQKISTLREIRNIPAATIFAIDLSKVKKNLQIQSLIYNFVITISGFEALAYLSTSTNAICFAFGLYKTRMYIHNRTILNLETNKSCNLTDYSNLGIYFNISSDIIMLLPILINLFLIVLRRAYLSVPYGRWLIGYSGYFLFRFVRIILSYCFIITQYTEFMVELVFLLFDSYVYLKGSKKFNLLLKGMSEEAKWHFTSQEYNKKRRAAKTFGILRSVFILAFIICLSIVMLKSINEFIKIIQNSDCLLQILLPNTPIKFTVYRFI